MPPSGEVRRRRNTQNPEQNAASDTPRSSMGSSSTPPLNQRPSGNVHQHHSDGPGDSNSNYLSTPSKTNQSFLSSNEEYAWFVVFLSAFAYFVVTRGGFLISSESSLSTDSFLSRLHNRGGLLSSLSKPYEVVSSNVWVMNANSKEDEELLKSIFYVSKSEGQSSLHKSSRLLALAPNHRLEIILSSPLDDYHAQNAESIAANGKDEDDEKCNTQSQSLNKPTSFFSHLLSTTWVHDSELGRGYLLLADAGRSGRIWRWEVGGGPITIGRSLHMERSGCRSGLWVDHADNTVDGKSKMMKCPENVFGESTSTKKKRELQEQSSSSCSQSNTTMTATARKLEIQHLQSSALPPLLGSASLAVELTRNAERSSCGGNLIVAEWGERRIIRVEGETGARTPLVTLVPDYPTKDAMEAKHLNTDHEPITNSQWRRLHRPNHLTYTPFGDLLFSDNFDRIIDRNNATSHNHVGTVYRLKEAVHIPPIPVEQSREAHGWMQTNSKSEEDSDSNGDDDHVGGGTENKIDVLFQTKGWIEGMALGGSDFSTLFVLVATPENSTSGELKGGDNVSYVGWTKTIYKLSLNVDDDDDDDEKGESGDDDDEKEERVEEQPQQKELHDGAQDVKVFYTMSSDECNSQSSGDAHPNNPDAFIGSKLALDEKGTVYMIACPSSILILSKEDGHVVGSLTLDYLHATLLARRNKSSSPFNSVNFGEDGYLYSSSINEVMRIKSRVGGMTLPTNLVIPPPLKVTKKDNQSKQRRDKRDKK